MNSLMIVEDEQIVALSLKHELLELGYEVVGLATTEQEAVQMYENTLPSLVLMDINLEGGGSGIEAAKKINAIKRVPIVYITAYANDEIVQLANEANPIGYIVKPYNMREVKAVIETAFHRFEYEKEIKSSEARLQVAIEAADLSVWEFNPEEHHLIFSGTEVLKEYLGQLSSLSLDEFLNLVEPSDRKKVQQVLSSGKKMNETIRVRSPKSNDEFWFEVYVSNLRLEGDKVRIGAMKDVTSMENHLKELKISKSIFSHIADGIIVFDEDCRVTRANPAFCKQTGLSAKQLISTKYDDLLKRSRHDDTLGSFKQLVGQKEVTFKTANGDIFYALTNGKKLRHKNGKEEVVMIVTDISDLKLAEKKLQYQAYRDELTGMHNRAYMNRAFADPNQYFDSGKFTLIFIDLDSFKLINDTHGHDFGDAVLREFAWRLKGVFRSSDKLIRHGGDEFVIMLDGQLTHEDAVRVVDSVNKVIREPFQFRGFSLSVTCSIGIAEWDETVLNTQEFMKRADIAMYAAKGKAKNNFQFYDANMGDSTHYQLFLEQGLRQAIEQEQLQLWLQPIVDHKGNVVSAEGLCRWLDEKAGMISPDDFIQVAEASWLIFPLGELMLQKACAALQQLTDKGHTEIRLGVNLSSKQLSHPTLPERFAVILNEHNIRAERITLEITETALSDYNAKSNVTELRKMGFVIALDDFGRGYSSLEQLQQLNLDVIKIDKVFLEGLPNDEKAKTVCKHMISMATELGFKVVVEGIETEEQFEYFASNELVGQQGYWHGKAMPLDEFINMLKK
jgi:diguanylate cyclase (GGDEF)-like protein/PAS domain S-box-containing protein